MTRDQDKDEDQYQSAARELRDQPHSPRTRTRRTTGTPPPLGVPAVPAGRRQPTEE
jgi:hypothetical protein